MGYSNIQITELQKEIDRIQSGHCILVKLNNYDELWAMSFPVKQVIADLNQIILDICLKFHIKSYIQIATNKILVLIPIIDTKIVKQFAVAVYSKSQLYTNENFPESYMNCQMASIDFPVSSLNANIICNTLIGMTTSFKPSSYYNAYDTKLHNIEIIKTANRDLNLLRNALKNKKVQFVYQPIIDRKTGHIPYYEGLLRILDENNNLISVGTIIEDAEKKGLINVVDKFVFEMAVDELVRDPTLSLSINISNIGVLDEELLHLAESLLEKYDISQRLIVEITETSLNEDYERTKLFINRLHQYGCKFALDDFGSGFTSFKQLQNLPIDIIKIDGSYIRNIVNNHHNKYFVEVLVKLSEELGIKTVAEFVENGEIAKFLIDIKVDGLQGNFFCPASSNRIS